MIRKNKYVIASTHLDKQGYVMAKSALESMLPFLNGDRKPRLGLEHIRTFPPFGAIMNGEIVKGEDEHYYLTADMVYFDKQELITLDDGTQLLKEFFSEGEYPFIECADNEVEKLSIATDPANFEKHSDIQEIYSLVKQETDIEFETSEFGRKSELPDPETIITITKILAATLGIIKTKIPEKIGEAIGDDLSKFYKLISKLALETIKKVKLSNRPKNFVISYPNTQCNIELVITTHKPDRVLNSLTKEKLHSIADKVEQLENLSPEKIQFVYSENDNWEFNYLLSKNGSVIGSIKSFNKRNDLYNKILERQNKENEDSTNINVTTEIQIKPPAECSDAELKEFEQIVISGGQVDRDGLLNRIKQCRLLAFCYSQKKVLVGVSALKQKSKDSVDSVRAKAQVSTKEIPLIELGYSVTSNEFRGKGINRTLNDQLLEKVKGENVFATTDNDIMRKYLKSRGFLQKGSSFKGKYNQQLEYFERTKNP